MISWGAERVWDLEEPRPECECCHTEGGCASDCEATYPSPAPAPADASADATWPTAIDVVIEESAPTTVRSLQHGGIFAGVFSGANTNGANTNGGAR